VIKGWAPEAKGAMAATDWGMASSLLGKRVGDIKGLLTGLVSLLQVDGEWQQLGNHLRPMETSHLCKTVDDLVHAGPLEAGGEVFWFRVHVHIRVLQDKLSIGLEESELLVSYNKVHRSEGKMQTYFGEAVSIEHEGVEQLAKSEGLQHPAPPPPRPRPLLLDLAVGRPLPTPDHATVLCSVPPEFQGAK